MTDRPIHCPYCGTDEHGFEVIKRDADNDSTEYCCNKCKLRFLIMEESKPNVVGVVLLVMGILVLIALLFWVILY